MPPTKPTLPVLVVFAAMTPTTNEPSCSLNTIDWTFGRSTTSSMMPKSVLGYSGRDLLQRGLPGEADGHDRREAVLGELAQDLLALRLVLDLEIAELDPGLLGEPRRAVEHPLVERFVELAAEIVENRRLDSLGRIGRGGGEQTSGQNRRCHERGASEHILTSHWRERLPGPQRETNRLVE